MTPRRTSDKVVAFMVMGGADGFGTRGDIGSWVCLKLRGLMKE